MNKLIDAVKTFLAGVEYIEKEENANYVVTKEDKELLQEAIDTVVKALEKPLPTDKDIENEQNTLIEFSEYLENEHGIILPIELINEYTERNNNESNIN